MKTDINKINTVILGYGFSGKTFFSPFLHAHEGFELRGAWERSKKNIQKDYPEAISYGSLDLVLDDKEVDLVVVNTPIDTHYEYARKALEAGKHVIVEKAFTTCAEEAKTLHELAKSHSLHLFVFQNRRFDSDFRTVKKVLASGKLGELVEATFSYDFYIPEIRGDVHTEHPKSGGEYNNRGSHITDQAVSLFGIPEAVLADFAAFRADSNVEDYFNVTLMYPDKRVVLRATDISLEHQPGYVLQGRRGSYIQDRTDFQEDLLLQGTLPNEKDWSRSELYKRGVLAYMTEEGKVIEEIPSESGNYYDYFEGVYQTLRHERPAHVTGYDGYRTMVVMDAARRSAEEGRRIKIDYHDIEK